MEYQTEVVPIQICASKILRPEVSVVVSRYPGTEGHRQKLRKRVEYSRNETTYVVASRDVTAAEGKARSLYRTRMTE